MLKIIIPRHGEPAYRIAGEIFRDMWKQTCGGDAELVYDLDNLNTPFSGDTVVIGSDSTNRVTADLFIANKIDELGIVYEDDVYALKSYVLDGQNVLFIAGGRGRSTIYAVYRYFEVFAGCRYYWDGDRIPHSDSLPLADIDINERPRFKYRGLRYFAHRSLHRFQAEHWSLEDWKQEIDWMMKKRLNMFMLRIGIDDLFQRAFPDIVPYPELKGKIPEAGEGCHDRSLFWSLEYRGKLREAILDYAFERDLIHPEDCGTMTHWYSRTPRAYLDKVKPKLFQQTEGSGYGEDTGLVWDVFEEENLETYGYLTDTYVKEYGKPEIFHTIGFAERNFSADRESNMRLKLYVYRRIQQNIAKKYPNAPLFIASWDLWMNYTYDEVKRLLRSMDTTKTILLDYTSDSLRDSNFTKWDVMGKFPWVFGIFGAFENNNDIRGDYDHIDRRMTLAKADEKCIGMIYWPELSHGDTFVLEYLVENAWSDKVVTKDELVAKISHDRYDAAIADKMQVVWDNYMPISAMRHWDGSAHKEEGYMIHDVWADLWFYDRVRECAAFMDELLPAEEARILPAVERGKKALANGIASLQALHEVLTSGVAMDDMLRRDAYDLARGVISRYVDHGILAAQPLFIEAKKDESKKDTFYKLLDTTYRLNEILLQVLAGHEDYSMYETLKRIRATAPVNPDFEPTLKNNSSHSYCRAAIYESARALYLPEMEILFDAAREAMKVNGSVDVKPILAKYADNKAKNFDGTPLEDMVMENVPSLASLLPEAIELIAAMGNLI